jgi:integrase/recombinase XerD
MTIAGCSDPLPSHLWHAGPWASHINCFAARLAEQGSAPFTAHEKLRLGTHLSQGLQEQHVGAEALDEACLSQCLQYRQQQGRAPRHHRVTVRTFLKEFRDAGMLAVPARQDSALDVLVQAFDDSLTSTRGLARITRDPSRPSVRRFLPERFGAGPLVFQALTIHDVTQCLLRPAATVSPRHAQSIVSALRTFGRFLVQRGDLSADLAAALPAVADWRLATVPKAMPPAQVTQLLQSCNQHHPTGQRDDTMMLLMARLGLRPGAVVARTLEDLDWEEGTLLVRGQGGRRDRLPPHAGPAMWLCPLGRYLYDSPARAGAREP